MEPPVVLVNTWGALVRLNEDQEIKEHALQFLKDKIGDHKAISTFMKNTV